jgi:hypothetical protein
MKKQVWLCATQKWKSTQNATHHRIIFLFLLLVGEGAPGTNGDRKAK